jgi:carboxypeptidase family protein
VFKGTRLKTPDLSKLEIFLDGPGVHGKQGPIFARADGSFEGPAWPGLPTITTVLPDSADPGWYLASAMLNGRDLLDRPPELERATGDLTGVVLTFLDRPTRLAGTVTDTAGIPATGCTVVVFPADRQLWSSLYRRLRSARPDTKGRFVFDNLPPGNYLMTTVPDLDPRSWRTPAFLETLISTSQRLSLGEGEQKTQDLRR